MFGWVGRAREVSKELVFFFVFFKGVSAQMGGCSGVVGGFWKNCGSLGWVGLGLGGWVLGEVIYPPHPGC